MIFNNFYMFFLSVLFLNSEVFLNLFSLLRRYQYLTTFKRSLNEIPIINFSTFAQIYHKRFYIEILWVVHLNWGKGF